MAFLSCARCGLEISIQVASLRLEDCPRCLARSARVVPLVLSSTPVTPAVGWGSRAPDHRRARPGQAPDAQAPCR